MQAQFDHVAEEKGLAFNITLTEGLPEQIITDRQRVRQIVKNLLSNAFKFTEQGSVSLHIYRPQQFLKPLSSGLEPAEAIAIRVSDTGVGMTPEQQQIVFEAFQQAEAGTSRKYGGTGLGLSISRELALNLGGGIELESELGQGSSFTLYLPEVYSEAEALEVRPIGAPKPVSPPAPPIPAPKPAPFAPAPEPAPSAPAPKPAPFAPAPEPVPDDRDTLTKDDKILLIIEDDPRFAKVVSDFAHRKGFKSLIALEGGAGLDLVDTYRPDAVVLDLNLPDMSGWEVLSVLKHNPDTQHIPVHIMSAEYETLQAYRRGAMGFLTKPVTAESLDESFQRIEGFISRQVRTLLLVEDEVKLRRSVKKLLGGSDVEISEVGTGQGALELLRSQTFDCVILDLSLPDMSGFEVLNRIHQDEAIAKCPLIVYTGQELSPEENAELMKYADSIIVKGVKSPERLLDETALFLHRVVSDLPKEKQQTIRQLHSREAALEGKKVLIVDDDMRNSFALSKLLGDKGLIVEIASDGQEALKVLATQPDIDLVLMDLMMPVMDGYETIRRIRVQRHFRDLPILALTAKAMKGDREECLEAGANDYLPKPIDPERLFSMLRVWLYQ
jgi:tubulin-specific chaperone A